MKTKTVKKSKKTKEVICANCGEKVNADKCYNFKTKDAQGFFNFRNDIVSDDKIFFCYDCCPTPMPSLDELPRPPLDSEAALEIMRKIHKNPIIETTFEEIASHGNSGRVYETSYIKFINEECGKGVKNINEFDSKRAIRHIMNEMIQKKDIKKEGRSDNAKKAGIKSAEIRGTVGGHELSKYIIQIIKKHSTWGYQEILDDLENENDKNPVTEIDNEYIYWMSDCEEKRIKKTSLRTLISNLKKRLKIKI